MCVPRPATGVWGGGGISVREASEGLCECVCACKPKECCGSAFTTEFLSLLARDERGFESVFCTIPVWKCHLRQPLARAACVTGHVLSLCMPVCIWDMCSALLPAEPAKKKAGAMSPSLGREPRSFGHSGAGLEWLGGSGRSLYLT